MQTAWPYPIGLQICLHFNICDVGLFNSLVRPIKLRWCVFNKGFLVIFLIVVANAYVLVTLRPKTMIFVFFK